MNVMIYNKYKDLLMGLNIEVMKSLEGVYNVDEIIDTFSNFYYDKMILDITAIRDYQNVDNLQKLAMNINMENVILLLDNSPETDTKTYLSKLISIGIYNFTRNVDGINYLLVHPHTYKDVVNIHNLQELDAQNNNELGLSTVGSGRLRVIGFKNVTPHAGATSLIYMLKKNLIEARTVSGIEVNKVDFMYFNDDDLVSSTTNELLKDIMKKQSSDIILVDLNDYEEVDICTEVYYLIEPSTIMINRLLRKNKNILEELKDKKIVLNKCSLNSEDVATFEYETKLRVFSTITPVDDRQATHEPIKKFISKMNL
ncbi:MAG: hypothetical protein IJ966_07305 [Bacilli bacterium]|nr:hypothetical protein [Bacilli bacterium]